MHENPIFFFFDRRQCVKETEFQMMFAREAPERLEKFSGRAAKSCTQLCPRLPLAVFGQLSKNKEAAYSNRLLPFRR